MRYFLCLCLYLYLNLYHALLMEVMQPVAEPDLLEDVDTVLVLVVQVQMQVQVEEQIKVHPIDFGTVQLVQVQMPVQAEAEEWMSLDIDLVKQHTAVPDVVANSGKQELVEAYWHGA